MPPRFSTPVGRRGHVGGVGAHHDDVVAVVGNGGGHRAALEAVALEIAQADVAGALVPLDDGDFQDVPLQIHPVGVTVVGGDDLAVHQPDDAPAPLVAEIVGAEGADVEGVVGPLREIRLHRRHGHLPQVVAVVPQLALFEYHLHLKVLEIVHHRKVGQVPWGDGSPVVELIIPGGVVAGGLDGDDGIHPLGDGPADDIVDVALVEQVVGMLVVGAEHAAVVVPGRQQGQQGVQVPGRGALPDHDELPQLELQHRILQIGALVVRVDAGGHIGAEIRLPEAGGVAVNLLVVGLGRHDLLQRHRIGGDDAGVIHHLRQAVDPGMVVERVDGPVIQRCAGLVHGRGGDAGGQHEAHVDGQALGGLQHIVDAVGAHDVGDLMGIGDDRGGAVGSTARANSRGLARELSRWMWASMKPGRTIFPDTSYSFRPV